jgi:surfeit locus 1 family protein
MRKLFPHLFVFFGFILLFSLGTWQLNRLAWKEDLMQKINTRINAAPIEAVTNLDTDEFSVINLTGEYDYAHELQIMGRPFNGKPGVHVLTPLKTANGTIIVNRGWAKYDESYDKPTGTVSLQGIIRTTQKLSFINKHIIMDNNPEKNVWFWVDLPTIYKFTGAPELPYYVERVSLDKPNSYPYALEKKINLYNEHLNYAITWYLISVALIIMYYFRFHRK